MTTYAQPKPGAVHAPWLDDENAEPYPCLIAGYWNGFVEPLFDEDTLTRIARDINGAQERSDDPPAVHLQFEDGRLVLTEYDGDTKHEAEIPFTLVNGEQRWECGFGWTWQEADPPEVDIAPKPSPSQRDAFRVLQESLGLNAHGHTIEVDGSHTIAVLANLGNPSEHRSTSGARVPLHEPVAEVNITRNGKVRVWQGAPEVRRALRRAYGDSHRAVGYWLHPTTLPPVSEPSGGGIVVALDPETVTIEDPQRRRVITLQLAEVAHVEVEEA